MRNKESSPNISCPDCKGSGQYVGLTVVEPCRRCRGSGAVRPRVAVIKRLEDERATFQFVLELCGFDVITFPNVRAYLDEELEPPDCIIVSWGRYAPDALLLERELNRRGTKVPLVVSSSREVRGPLPESVVAVVHNDDLTKDEYVAAIRDAAAASFR